MGEGVLLEIGVTARFIPPWNWPKNRSFKPKCSPMPTTYESFKVNGENLVNKIKELIHEGNIRKIIIQDAAGKELMSFPLTVGVVGTLFAPVLAAVGGLAALMGNYTITVERETGEIE